MKKYIAPIIIGIVLVVYMATIGYDIFTDPYISGLNKFFGLIIPAGLGGVSIAVTVQRVREIKGGEEDEASKY